MWMIALVAVCGTLLAQSDLGSISGTVLDPTGALIQNAKITVSNVATNQVRALVTPANGRYNAALLPPGNYTVKAEAPGFAKYETTVDVVVGMASTVEIRMTVASAGQQTVEVTAEGAVVQANTSDQTQGEVITPKQMAELPSLTRNPYDFASTSGNVSEDAGGRGLGISVNGARSASIGILLDGSQNADTFSATGAAVAVPLDSVQEYTVLTSNFTAEFGHAGGGVVNVATKSGGNKFHGSLYEYNRISALAANTYAYDADNYSQVAQGLSPLPKANFTRNQFGYSIGGPVKKDKLFFFSNTEWTRVRSSQNYTAYVFDPAFIALTGANTQAFWEKYGTIASGVTQIGTPLTASRVAAGMLGGGSPNFDALAASDPSLSVLDLVNLNAPADSGAGMPQDTYNTVNRIDFNLSEKTQIWGRYALYNQVDFSGTNSYSPYQGFNTGMTNHNQSVVLAMSHLFTPTLANLAKIQFSRQNHMEPFGQQPLSPTLYISSSLPTINGVAPLFMPGYWPSSDGMSLPFGGPQNVYEYSDQLLWSKGKHRFAFGGEYINTRDNHIMGAWETGSAYLGQNSDEALDALLASTIYQYTLAIDPKGQYPCQTDRVTGQLIDPSSCTVTLPATEPKFDRMNRFSDGNVYAQDAWQVTKRLTVNLGLRWEYFGVQHNANPRLDSNLYYSGALNPTSISNGQMMLAPDSPIGEVWKPSKKNFAPRVGFAYALTSDGKTSLRGGYGITYEKNFGNVTFNIFMNPPNYAVANVYDTALPVDNLGPFNGTGTTLLSAPTIRIIDPNIKTAYENMYTLDLEREITRNTLLDIGYSGSRGIHQYAVSDANRYYGAYGYNGYALGSISESSLQAQRTNTQYGVIALRSSNGDYWYNGMNLKLRSTNFKDKGLLFTLDYTWSHSIDDLSSTFNESLNQLNVGLGYLDWMNPKMDRGDSDYDIRQRITFNAVYQPKIKLENKLLGAVANGWSIAPISTWHTGTPFTLFDCYNQWVMCARPLVIDSPGSRVPIKAVDPVTSPNTFTYFQYGTYVPYNATIDGVQMGIDEIPSCNNGVCAYPSNMIHRNSARVPNVWSFNFAVSRNFRLNERFSLQFRTEAYNLFNHSNYYVNYGATDVEYGGDVSVNKGNLSERRNMQMALRLQF
jgi:hypothetical protein